MAGQQDMATAQALDMACRMDLGFQIVDKCWMTCFDTRLTRDELSTGIFSEAKFSDMNKCQTKCIARYFEAMQLMMDARMQREREQAGLH